MNYAATLKNVETQNEVHDDSQIILKVYEDDKKYVFSVDVKLGRFVRSHYPKPEGEKYSDENQAKRAAVRLLEEWASGSKTIKKYLNQFPDLKFAGQPTLFDF